MQGQRKIHGKSPERASFDPGVQLTQPKTSLSASGNRTVSTRPSRQRGGKKGRQRHHHQQDGSAEGGKRRRKDRDQRKGRSRFQWAEKGLTPCSRPCGGGNQTAILSCERKRKKKVVPDRRCSHLVRPQARVVLCNLTPCPATWMPGEWGPCSVTCGMGVQTRKLMCKQVVSPTLTMMVPEGACLSPPSVPTSQVCETRSCNPGPIWETGPWTNCSAPCGLGTRGRQVSCVMAGVPVDEDQCSTSVKPTAEEVCDMGSCATNIWFVSDWSNQCSESCGTGIQTRRVHCLGGDQMCPAASRPDTTRPCLGESGCGGQWFIGVWSECSEPCGGGQETRGVACMVSIRGRWRVTQEVNCNVQDRPQDSRDCNLHPCTPQWFTSDWSQCSVSCDGGVMQREVTCLDTSFRASPDCLNTTRPAARQSCHLHSCTSQPALSQSASPTLIEDNDHQATDDTEDAGLQGTRDDSLQVTESQDTGISTDEIEVSTEEEGREEGLELENELVVEETTGSGLNVIPDKDAQGDESVASNENGHDEEETHDREEEEKKKKKRKRKKDRQKDRDRQVLNNSTEISKTEAPNTENISCIDRIKNCHLVFRARLCRLRYYNKLCCRTCSSV